MNIPENKPDQKSTPFPTVKIVFGWQSWILLIFLFGMLRGAIEDSARHNSQEISQLQNEVRSLETRVSQLQLKIEQLPDTPE
ncbi:MAG: hypothetical protein ACFB14_27490 [Leptolyngbyaceae cyanobacterium]